MLDLDQLPSQSGEAFATFKAADRALRLVSGRRRRMQLTKGARFEAARRHKFSGRSSGYSIVILSVWIFTLSVYVLIYPDGSRNNYINALNLILSFFVIAFSLLQGAKRHELRSEMFLKCAQEIDEISTDLSVDERRSESLFTAQIGMSSPDLARVNEEVERIFKYISSHDSKYQKILMSFSDNHSDIDYNVYIFKSDRNPKKTKGIEWIKLLIESMYWRAMNFWYVRNTMMLAIVLPILALAYQDNVIGFLSGGMAAVDRISVEAVIKVSEAK